MFREEKNIKNLKDINPTLLPPLSGEGWERLSYTKTDKLITALYMVTDIIDKDEPLRNKLRTLGIEILSDISSRPSNICIKISEIMSFLDIASAMDIISGMNFSILKKEFLELNQSIIDFTGGIKNTNRQINLSEFFREGFSPLHLSPHPNPLLKGEGELNSIGHTTTRIGVQKGSTLMKALSGVGHPTAVTQDFNIFKKQQRRDDIMSIIKTIGGNATIKDIKDIKDKAQSLPAEAGPQSKVMSLISCSEKTLQRELISMVKDNVLNKIGEKRWSRYFLR